MPYIRDIGNREYLRIATLIEPFQRELTPEQRKFLPPARYRGSPRREMWSNREISRECYTAFVAGIRGKHMFCAKEDVRDPVRGVMHILMERGLMVPTFWTDPPKYLRCGPGERYLYNSRGQIIFDKEMARLMGTGISRMYGMRNPEWGIMHSPKLEQKFEPFAHGYVPSEVEKRERVMHFLAMYAETGHMMASGKSAGSTFYQLLLWANEYPDLMEQVALAEAAVHMGIRGNAQFMALEGDKQMIALIYRDQAIKNAQENKGKKRVQGVDISDEIAAAMGIAERAEAKFKELQAGGDDHSFDI